LYIDSEVSTIKECLKSTSVQSVVQLLQIPTVPGICDEILFPLAK